MSPYKISFCTVCMDRLHHLRQTLPVNMLDNKDYPDLEFVLLDYNSSDSLETYIKETFGNELKSGKLIFYKTTIPQYFNRSHSRNLVNKLATGDILCNIDADNYTGTSFASYINNEFKNGVNVFLTPIGSGQKKDVLGRTCVKRDDFFSIGGYDERMATYGFEDFDFINRLALNGLTKILITRKLDAIGHDESERLSNEFLSGNLNDFYISYITPSSTDFLFLFKNNTFKRGVLIDNATYNWHKPVVDSINQLNYTHSILQDEWIEGTWKINKNEIILSQSNKNTEKLFFDQYENCFVNGAAKSAPRFYKLSDPQLIQDAIMFLSQITNRLIMEKNNQEKKHTVNAGNFGNGTVYKNFDDKNPIVV